LSILGLTLRRLALAGVTLAYTGRIEAERVDITHVPLTLPRLEPAFDGYRIAQISDIHMDTWMTRERLMAHVERVMALAPDLVAITGDFVTRTAPYKRADMQAALAKLAAPDGVVAVMGNHDHRKPGEVVHLRQMLATLGITELRNCAITLRRDGACLHLAGVDSVAVYQARLDLALAQIPDEGCALLLAHEPDFADVAAATGRFDLQLSGHTHGGQIRLLGLAPMRPAHGRRYVSGLHNAGGMYLYVNRGLGMVGIPLRVHCAPEITVFTLRAPQSAPQSAP
jgi:hypothetical protein